ncbi:MAG: cardiolipin synthase, partial [Verrucomicrobia bacterium]|nr:cardiolipin synthase [Verrucomicrobiota bacterium]
DLPPLCPYHSNVPHPESIALLTAIVVLLMHCIGILHILHALMHVRTSQGTIAWIVCLALIPYVAIPFYWILGRSKFEGSLRARRADDERLIQLSMDLRIAFMKFEADESTALMKAAEKLGGFPQVHGNEIEVLIDGEATFDALFRAIKEAHSYILVNFFIVKSDRVGTRFKDALVKKAREGVRVHFLFDEFGSHKLPKSYLREMEDAGIQTCSFGANRYWWSRLQLNFRNHRKIVVIDGREAFLGGLNVGDEYLGRSERFGAWRDTHLRFCGPAVQAVQLVFLEDWFWAADDVPEVTAAPIPCAADQRLQIMPTGPADTNDSWQLFVIEAASLTTKRLWITSPYFVPDDGVLSALQAAALRGVDVRILLPEKSDHLLVYLSSFSFYEAAIPTGIRLFRFTKGFLHQKVLLSDIHTAIGTANLDNRSFRLNFEITALSTDPTLVSRIEGMLTRDFEEAREASVAEFTSRSFLFRAACRAARLMAPIQ